jgi:hypothetical protein
LNIKDIFDNIINDIKNIDGVDDANIIMKFLHVTNDEPDYHVYICEEDYHIDKSLLQNKVDDILKQYNDKYHLSEHDSYIYSYIE